MFTILRQTVVVFLQFTILTTIRCHPESYQAAIIKLPEFLKNEGDDCKFVLEGDGYMDPCLRQFGDYTYEYCPNACREDYCKCCRNGTGCPTITVDNCLFVYEGDGYMDPCLRQFGDYTYQLCPNACREGSCLCCEAGKGCPYQQVTKDQFKKRFVRI